MSNTATLPQETCESLTPTICRNQPGTRQEVKNKLQLSATCEISNKATNECPTQICYEKVRELAYYKWERAGYPSGDGLNFWLEAETELQAEST